MLPASGVLNDDGVTEVTYVVYVSFLTCARHAIRVA